MTEYFIDDEQLDDIKGMVSRVKAAGDLMYDWTSADFPHAGENVFIDLGHGIRKSINQIYEILNTVERQQIDIEREPEPEAKEKLAACQTM